MFGLQRCIAVVGDNCITLREYRYELMRYSDLLDNPKIREIVKQQVLYNMVSREALYQKALSLGFVVSDKEVAEIIKSDKGFYENDKFSFVKYQSVLERIGLTPEEYELGLKKILTVQKFLDFIEKSFYVTEKEINLWNKLLFSKISGKFYILTSDKISISYKPTQEEIERYYKDNLDKFKTKPERKYRLWKTSDKKKAYEIYTKLKKGEIPEEGIIINKDNKDIPEDVFREIERLSPRNRQSILKISGIYYIVYIEDLKEGRIKSLKEVREQIEKTLIESKKEVILKEEAYKFAENLRKGKKVRIKPVAFENSKAEDFVRLFGIDIQELVRVVFSADKIFGPYKSGNRYVVISIEKRLPVNIKNGKDIKQVVLKEKSQDLLDMYMNNLISSIRVKINEEQIR